MSETSETALLTGQEPAARPRRGELPGLWSRQTTMAVLDVEHEDTMLKYEKQGLPVHKRGNLRFYDPQEVAEWIRGGRSDPAPRPRGRPKKAIPRPVEAAE